MEKERHFVTYVIVFFATSRGIVLKNLARRFICEVQLPKAQAFYGFHIVIKNIHSEMYCLLLETYIKGSAKKSHLFCAIKKVPYVARKVKWALRQIDAFETFSNKLISWDEGFCCDFTCLLYSLRNTKLFKERVQKIVADTFVIEKEFLFDALPCTLVRMNADLMSQ
ncbi:hypothetical protein HPP92_024732 [Vanilla planifolia]|uniref:Uncharacterized protein n=1 Tax=Vanilla planifolia TaxID=51239 RepID=A0A835UBT4_VANPL|nr:hypothetical protein HPP92_024732 [Vanilla planifolia]